MIMRLTKAQQLMLDRIKEMEPVSELRLGVIKAPARRVFKALIDKGLLEPVGKGMLGTNWQVARQDIGTEQK
jgi:hypothetical protein